jgi:hypothetical protein
MTLTVFERLTLLNILPAEGDIITLRVLRKLAESLSFTEEEHARLQFRDVLDADGQKTGRIEWKTEADQPTELEIGRKAQEIIAARFRELNAQKKLRPEHIDLYDKFVPEE